MNPDSNPDNFISYEQSDLDTLQGSINQGDQYSHNQLDFDFMVSLKVQESISNGK
jgi:hypothetical protein